MLHRQVGELMTAGVVRVGPDATFKDIVRQLAENDITAVPVVDDQGRPLGVVSEADLLRKEEGRPDPGGHVLGPPLPPSERERAEALTAEQLMTSPAVTAREQWSAVEAARTMANHHVKRLPVVDEADRLIGIVSRGDLLRLYLRHDRAVQEEITTDVLTRILGLSRSAITVDVADGRVTLRGTVERRSLIPVVVHLCESVDGVVDVTEDLEYVVDDRADMADVGRRHAPDAS
jgi:CBS domain-containing protein